MNKHRKFIFTIFSVLMLVTGCGPTSASSSETPPASSETPSLSSETPVSSEIVSEEPPPVTTPESVTINRDGEALETLALEVGDELTLEATVLPATADQAVTWSSTSPNTVSINKRGEILAIKKGFATLSAVSVADSMVRKNINVVVTFDDPQEGVGSGLSPEDPIYKGQEGSDGPLEIYFLETFVTYADSMLLKKGNIEIMIDGGNTLDGTMNKDFIASKIQDGRLDMMIASHSHTDHVNAIPEITDQIENISTILDFGTSPEGSYANVVDKFVNRGAVHRGANDSAKEINGAAKKYYFTEDFYVEVLETGAYTVGKRKADNNHSLALIFHYKDFTFYTAGDLEKPSERSLLIHEPNLPEVTLAKLSHHGAISSNSPEILNKLNPNTAMITSSLTGLKLDADFNITSASGNLDGTGGGHPDNPTIESLYKAPRISQNLNVYWNGSNGRTKITTYGHVNDLVIQGSPTRNGYYDLTLTDGVGVWDEEIGDFKNKVTGEENKKLHETKIFVFRGYQRFLPEWARDEFFPNN